MQSSKKQKQRAEKGAFKFVNFPLRQADDDVAIFIVRMNVSTSTDNLATMKFSYVASTSKAKYEMIFTSIKRGIFSQG